MQLTASAALGAAVLLAVSGLSGCGNDAASGAPTADSEIPAGPPSITIAPSSGSKNVATDTKVWVQARNAKLTEVRVTDDDNREVGGTLSPDGTSWQAEAPVRVDTGYRVNAWAVDAAGQQVEETSTFTSKDIKQSGTLRIESVTPSDGAKVGVAHPLVVAFTKPVANRRVIQSALKVTTSRPVEGAWYWVDDTHVHYRPATFWPANTEVKLQARIAERNAGEGVLGGVNKTSAFTVVRNQELRVDADRKTLTVVRDGRPVKKFDVTTGKPGWETRNGIKVMMTKVGEKEWNNEEIDAPEEYEERSQYAIRLTNSGEFIHDAPWNEATIGETNASHGCIGLRTKDMRWIWKNSVVGDPVIVTGSPEEYKDLTNRYADWNIPWSRWKRGNAG